MVTVDDCCVGPTAGNDGRQRISGQAGIEHHRNGPQTEYAEQGSHIVGTIWENDQHTALSDHTDLRQCHRVA